MTDPGGGPQGVQAPPRRLTGRERRWQRRRRRRAFEELLGWVLVPIILVVGYWAIKGSLNALGTSPTAIVAQVKQLISGGRSAP